jgi:hypothetical protein
MEYLVVENVPRADLIEAITTKTLVVCVLSPHSSATAVTLIENVEICDLTADGIRVRGENRTHHPIELFISDWTELRQGRLCYGFMEIDG